HRAALEGVAAAGAAVDALGGADIDDVRVLRMHGNRVHLGVLRQPAAELLPFVGADFLAKDAGEVAAVLHSNRAGYPGVKCRHRSLLSLRFNCSPRLLRRGVPRNDNELPVIASEAKQSRSKMGLLTRRRSRSSRPRPLAGDARPS